VGFSRHPYGYHVFWLPGFLVLWFLGFLVFRFLGFLVFRFSGFLVFWFSGFQAGALVAGMPVERLTNAMRK
jgi:hypothetical protein